MASIQTPNIFAKKQFGASVIGLGMAVKAADTDGKYVTKSVASTDKHVGIAQNATLAADDIVEMAAPGGGAKGLAGGTIATGDKLTANASGALVSTVAPGDTCIAVAEQNAVAGDIFACTVGPFLI